MKSFYRIVFSCLLLLITTESLHSQEGKEAPGLRIDRLETSQTINTIGHNSRELSLINQFRKLDPNFLAKAFYSHPVQEGREGEFLREVRDRICRFDEYEKIPYFSARSNGWFQLFYDISIEQISETKSGGVLANISARMQPFSPGNMIFEVTPIPDGLVVKNWNVDPLLYNSFSAVSAGEMLTGLVIQIFPGELRFYGLGGGKAFDFFGLFRDRLETAFLGRVDAYFKWLFDEIGAIKLPDVPLPDIE